MAFGSDSPSWVEDFCFGFYAKALVASVHELVIRCERKFRDDNQTANCDSRKALLVLGQGQSRLRVGQVSKSLCVTVNRSRLLELLLCVVKLLTSRLGCEAKLPQNSTPNAPAEGVTL
eukprot:2261989-Amphidinium_carterae.1